MTLGVQILVSPLISPVAMGRFSNSTYEAWSSSRLSHRRVFGEAKICPTNPFTPRLKNVGHTVGAKEKKNPGYFLENLTYRALGCRFYPNFTGEETEARKAVKELRQNLPGKRWSWGSYLGR